MSADRDPVQRAAGDDDDLYGVATWEQRTAVDRFSAFLYDGLKTTARVVVIALAVLVVLLQFATAAGLVFVNRPIIAVYVLLSVVPALGVAAYIWRADVTVQEPLELLVVTFALGFLFAGFAAILNTLFSGLFLRPAVGNASTVLAFAAPALYFFLIVGPVEETVKWLAVRLYAYRSSRFDAVVDGAVYGAVAGLGFATIENGIYVAREVLTAAQATGGPAIADAAIQTAAVRTLAGPGHVIYSAFAGYYLGLAKFNPANRGPIVVKGLLVASVLHATYNTVATNIDIVAGVFGVGTGLAFIGFVVVYDGALFYALYRKLSAYRAAFVRTGATTADDARSGADAPADDAATGSDASTDAAPDERVTSPASDETTEQADDTAPDADEDTGRFEFGAQRGPDDSESVDRER